MKGRLPKYRPLSTGDKAQAVFLHTQGVEDKEIANRLKVDARRISGYLRTQINSGRIPHHPHQEMLRRPVVSEIPMEFRVPTRPSFVSPGSWRSESLEIELRVMCRVIGKLQEENEALRAKLAEKRIQRKRRR